MKKEKIKNILVVLVIVIVIILIFDLVDYFIHSLSDEYTVPSRYYANKFIYGSLIGLVTYFFVRKKSIFMKSLVFSFVISLLLQTRYFLEGYSLEFVIEFFIIHFIILLPISWLAFYLFKNQLNKEVKDGKS